MTIESVNLASGNSSIEGSARMRLLPGKDAIPDDFANALTEQVGLLTEAKGRLELVWQTKTPPVLQSIANSNETKATPIEYVGEQQVVDLLDKYAPFVPEKKSTIDIEATLRALTDTLTPAKPAITTNHATIRRDASSVTTLPFVNSVPEETKLSVPNDGDAVATDFVQKDSVRSLIQGEQEDDLQSAENSNLLKKPFVAEKQPLLLEIEQGVSCIAQADRRLDDNADILVLTNPNWSENTNGPVSKAIPAAEIGLNPGGIVPISIVNQDQVTSPPAHVKNILPKEFANASIGQGVALNEAKGQLELVVQTKNSSILQSTGNAYEPKNLLSDKSDEKQLAALLDKYALFSPEKKETADFTVSADLGAALRALTNTLTTAIPGIAIADATIKQDMRGAMLPTGLPFVKSALEEAKVNMPIGDVVAGDFLQKDSVRSSIQGTQGGNLQFFENSKPLKKMLVAEKQSSSLETEQVIPSIAQPYRQLDNATDIPTLTNALTHPDLNKNPGEQIAGINNAIPTAEIGQRQADIGLMLAVNQKQATALHGESKNAISENFANTSIGPLGLLNAKKIDIELVGQMRNTPLSSSIESNSLLSGKSTEKEITALLDKYAAFSPEKNETADLTGGADLEATLRALTNTLTSATPGIPTADATIKQDMRGAMPPTGLPFVKPVLEETKVNTLTGDVVAGDFLQKDSARLSIQEAQVSNLQFLENSDTFKKTLVAEKQFSALGIEQTASGIAHPHRPLDNRTDIPVLTKPLNHPDWSKDLGEQIVWMNNKAIPAAEIRLNPAHLGPISVRIDVSQDQATVMFTALHAEVKDAIETSLPKLREMLAAQQLNLVNVNISQNSTSDQGRSQAQFFSKASENNEPGIEGVNALPEKIEQTRVVVSKGLLNLYA